MATRHPGLIALAENQANTLGAISDLQKKEIPLPEDHTPELTDRLRRIEELIQTVIEQGHERGPDIPMFQAPPTAPTARTERTESISESDNSLGRLARILSDLASPSGVPHMPTPLPAHAGPSMARQLEDILSRGNITSMTSIDAPRIVPFSYQPADRGERMRSPSPVSMDTLPLRPVTVPIIHEYIAPPPLPPQRLRPYAHQGPPRSEGHRDSVGSYVPVAEVPPWVPPRGQPPVSFRDEPPRAPEPPQERPERFHERFHGGGPPGPTPHPILVITNIY